MKILIFTPIAERDVHFYLAAANFIKSTNVKVVFVSFFQPGNQLIINAGYEVYDPYLVLRESGNGFKFLTSAKLQDAYSVSYNELILHEKLTFGIPDDETVINKCSDFFQAIEMLLLQIEKAHPEARDKSIVQELAGFVGPLALFHCGMKRGWKHYFLEPGFFKGRLHFDLNSLFCNIPTHSEVTDEDMMNAKSYLHSALQNKLIIAPIKDSHHYKDMGLAKIATFTNLKKITKKLYFKYVKGEKQEFDKIWNHVRRNLQMFVNRRANAQYYSQLQNLPKSQKLIYFPFHVQLDFALTVRSPECLDQLSLLNKILEVIPDNMVLVTKEHPASIGCLDQNRLEKLIKHPQFRLLHPTINTYDIMKSSCGVITINSKVGAEALSLGLPVLSFGRSFYTGLGFAETFENWIQTRTILQNWMQIDSRNLKPSAKWLHFLACVWKDGFSTELYDLNSANVKNFADACLTKMK